MRQNEITLLYSYIYRNKQALEFEVKQLQNNVRFRKIDIADCMELACALQRLETFNEVTNHIRLLLHLGGSKK